MMMFDFVLPYALEFNSDAVHAIRSDLTSSSTSNDVPDDDQKNAIRATVLGDDLSFASAAWCVYNDLFRSLLLNKFRRGSPFGLNIAESAIAALRDMITTVLGCGIAVSGTPHLVIP